MADLDDKTLTKIAKLIPRLASDHDGEVTATVSAIMRTLAGSGASLHELAAMLGRKPRVVERIVYRDKIVEKVVEKVVYRDQPMATEGREVERLSRQAVREVGKRMLIADALDDKEAMFVLNMVALGNSVSDAAFSMTAKQEKWFRDIAARTGFDISAEGMEGG